MQVPTPTQNNLSKVFANFETLNDALDYASEGETGFNFYSSRCDLVSKLTYAELAIKAKENSFRMLGAGIVKGDRVALLAVTSPEFLIAFFACQYCGAIPVPLPPPMAFGRREAYIDQTSRQLSSSGAKMFLTPNEYISLIGEIAKDSIQVLTFDHIKLLPKIEKEVLVKSSDLSYIQYSSGSTRSPKGVAITHKNVMSNCIGMNAGVENKSGERAVSWLPFYHDLGLVGFMLGCLTSQTTVDYISPEDFAKRPLAWLKVIGLNKGTFSYSPSFGYELCSRVQQTSKKLSTEVDLSSWRVAGIGGEMIKPGVIKDFAKTFSTFGFEDKSFNPSYGMAECVVGATFSKPGSGMKLDHISKKDMVDKKQAINISNSDNKNGRSFVVCGRIIDHHFIEIRDDNGKILKERQVGNIYLSGPSIMVGYFEDKKATDEIIQDSWLNTGDLGYLNKDGLVVVGRAKDLMIVNGRNYWPQDVEWAVERIGGMRSGDVAAFTVQDDDGGEIPTILVEFKKSLKLDIHSFLKKVQKSIKEKVGLKCEVIFVTPRSLPKTTSGKLSRKKAKDDFINGIIKPLDVF